MNLNLISNVANAGTFGPMFFRRVCVDGRVYLRSSAEEVESYRREMARQRHLPPEYYVNFECLLSQGNFSRLDGFRTQYAQEIEGLPTATVNIRQSTKKHAAPSHIVPSLLRQTLYYDMVLDRPWLPNEYFALHGFACPGPFGDIIFDMTLPNVLALLGNGNHLKAMGATFMWALGATELAPVDCARGGR